MLPGASNEMRKDSAGSLSVSINPIFLQIAEFREILLLKHHSNHRRRTQTFGWSGNLRHRNLGSPAVCTLVP